MLIDNERMAYAAWSVKGVGDARSTIEIRGPIEAYELVHGTLDVPGLENTVGQHIQSGGSLFTPVDDGWPLHFNHLEDPPIALWTRGANLDPLTQPEKSVSIIGARAATGYGVSQATEMASELARAGYTIVSGGAFGVDKAAHCGALSVGGNTMAFVASAPDIYYPAAHIEMFEQIESQGLIVSEYTPGTYPSRQRFLERNRLIATMSAVTVVIEASMRSGSIHAAKLARAYQRLAALPGPVTSEMSAGPNWLIRSGIATLVTDAKDVRSIIE